MNPVFLYVDTKEKEVLEKAEELSTFLQLPMVQQMEEMDAEVLYLTLSEQGLFLCGNGQRLQADFSEMLKRLSKANLQREFLIKAAKVKGVEHPSFFDATAGFAQDSILLAAAGYEVYLYERNPVIYALLQDALDRALQDERLEEVVRHMHAVHGNSEEAMRRMQSEETKVDVIYLDPMFPERQKSALIKKKFQLLQKLEAPCSDEKDLLGAAFLAEPKKIIVKRPLKGQYLADRKPDYSLSGKAIRYDCFVNIKDKNH